MAGQVAESFVMLGFMTKGLLPVVAPLLLLARAAHAAHGLVDFTPRYELSRIEARDVRLALIAPAAGRSGSLRIASGHTDRWPGITLKPPAGRWDLSAAGEVALDVYNPTAEPVNLGLRVDNPGGDGSTNCIQEIFTINPGERRTVAAPLRRKLPAELGLFGMNGYPGGAGGGHAVDPAEIIQILVFIDQPKEDHVVEISSVRAQGELPPAPKVEGFFPFIDAFGQYIHKDWPGKVHAAADFAANRAAEEADLKAHPAPADRDSWGGWRSGWSAAPTGYFTAVNHGGRWWLVDPDGRPFWSYGVDCVGNGAAGPVEDRDRWYAALPAADPAFKGCFWKGDARSDDRYKGKQVQYFDFGAANVIRKYGAAGATTAADIAHRRLASWGFNSIGAWSDDAIYGLRRTPYTVIIHFGGRDLQASEGYWSRFRDVFDPSFRAELRKSLARQKGKAAGDPWCIGFFVDNELSWGDATDLGVWTLQSPPDQPAKRLFVGDLKRTYGTIDKLNAAWSTTHTGWEALLASTAAPDRTKARADLEAFTARTAQTYFRTCAEEVKALAPHQLYLGCRFAWTNDLAIRAAARSCDLLSFNLYQRSVAAFGLPAGIDRPVLIGEFHFGALDRGPFHTGLQPTANQAERAAMFTSYLEGALRNPVVVGAHWFQYIDEPTTGRFDGENYQIGMVDVCDTPYPETIAAARTVGAELYQLRGK